LRRGKEVEWEGGKGVGRGSRGSLGSGKGGKGKGGDKSPAWSSQDLGSTLGLHVAIIIDKTMFMMLSSWHSHCESSPGSFDECRTAPGGC